MKRTKEDADQTKRKLLDSAFREFLRNGIDKSKLEIISGKAGVTRGAFYWHFNDKHDLLDSLVEHKDLESLSITGEIFNSKLPPFEKLKKIVSLNFPELSNKTKEKQYVRMKVELYNYLNKKGDKRKIAEHFMRMCKVLLDQCKKNNELKNNVDTEAASQTILYICAGSYIRFNSLPEKLKSIRRSKKIAMDYLNLIHN